MVHVRWLGIASGTDPADFRPVVQIALGLIILETTADVNSHVNAAVVVLCAQQAFGMQAYIRVRHGKGLG